MKQKPRATGSITLDQPVPVSRSDVLTFTTTIDGLSGQEYPMVILSVEVDGALVYRRLDHPAAVPPWIIGAGSSPWLDPANPGFGRDGIGTAELWVYVPFRHQTAENVYRVASTPPFEVIW